ncbi:MAG TPA: hypothetical protein VLA16_12145 [Ideonella sp.]|nr:hypothetical protein [Ideonella sp.]
MQSWIVLFLLAVAGLASPAADAAGPARAPAWQDVGPTVDDSYLSRSPSLAIAGRQQPVVAYVRTVTVPSDGRQVGHVFVERWDGSAWLPQGVALNVKRRFAAELPRVVVDAQDKPIVVWYEAQNEDAGRFAVYVKRWSGSAWEQLGGALNTDPRRSALSPSLALGPDQQPVVALAESAVGGLAVRVRRWDGAQWQLIGGPDDIGLGAETQVAVDGAGQITVAYTAEVSFGLRQVFAKRWDGTQWSPLGGPLNRDPARPSASPSLAAAADGSVAIAWQEQADNASKVYAARWASGAAGWLALGGALDGGVASRSVVIPKLSLLKSGQPVVAWTEAATMQTHVQRWNGSAWLLLGDNPVIATSQRGYDLRVDVMGRPVLAHGESRAIFDGDVRVQRFGP